MKGFNLKGKVESKQAAGKRGGHAAALLCVRGREHEGDFRGGRRATKKQFMGRACDLLARFGCMFF